MIKIIGFQKIKRQNKAVNVGAADVSADLPFFYANYICINVLTAAIGEIKHFVGISYCLFALVECEVKA